MKVNRAFRVSLGAVLWTALACAAEMPWFDAAISKTTRWPTDGSDVSVLGSGTWRETDLARLGGEEGARTLAVETLPDERLAFDLVVPRAAKAATPLVIRTRAQIAISTFLPEIDPSDKYGLVPYESETDGAAYWGLAAVDGAMTWVKLTGATPTAGDEVEITITCRGNEVQYQVGETVLTSGETEWFAFLGDPAQVSSVTLSGEGAIASLTGVSTGAVEAKTLTIPELADCSVKGVQVGGVEVEAAEDGTYPVLADTPITVSFQGAAGKIVYPAAASFALADSGALPETAVPSVYATKDVVEISEIMASNADTLKTANGGEGLDWVEIHNKADFPVDLTGWYLSDNPGKKAAKWKTIQGRCTIPAGGYKVVWADDEYDDWTADEAWSPIGLSASGEPLFLADPAATKEKHFASSYETFGVAIKDCSVGLKDGKTGLRYFREATPGAANVTDDYNAPTPEIAFSVPHGWCADAFELSLSVPSDAAATIHYTLDGSSPTVSSPVYSTPLTIDHTTVVRAAVSDADSILQTDGSSSYLFLADILAQSSDVPTNFPASGYVSGLKMVYGMEPSIVSDYRERICRGFTNGISTISLVIDPKNLFDAKTGIYTNPSGDGDDWERQTQVELFSPTDAEEGFSVPAGLRIRGAASRSRGYPKHSFRLFFRSRYGLSKLKYPLFGDEGASLFQKIDLRTSQNFAWANGSDGDTFIHETFARDSQRDLGEPYNRSRYYHLFINGIYWGLYETEERVDGDYAESYFGGSAGAYDVIRTTQPGYVTEVVEGTAEAWSNLWDLAVNEGFADDKAANYQAAVDAHLVNPANLIHFMMTAHYAGDTDSPAAVWNRGGIPNNINAFHDRSGASSIAGFVFNRHDAEWSLGYGANNTTWEGTEKGNNGASYLKYENFGPAELQYRLLQNAAYRKLFSRLVHKACVVPGGALTDAVAAARFRARMAEIDDAIACESARWGHVKDDGTLYTYETWQKACQKCLDFMNGRAAKLVRQYTDRGWYTRPPYFFISIR